MCECFCVMVCMFRNLEEQENIVLLQNSRGTCVGLEFENGSARLIVPGRAEPGSAALLLLLTIEPGIKLEPTPTILE